MLQGRLHALVAPLIDGRRGEQQISRRSPRAGAVDRVSGSRAHPGDPGLPAGELPSTPTSWSRRSRGFRVEAHRVVGRPQYRRDTAPHRGDRGLGRASGGAADRGSGQRSLTVAAGLLTRDRDSGDGCVSGGHTASRADTPRPGRTPDGCQRTPGVLVRGHVRPVERNGGSYRLVTDRYRPSRLVLLGRRHVVPRYLAESSVGRPGSRASSDPSLAGTSLADALVC